MFFKDRSGTCCPPCCEGIPGPAGPQGPKGDPGPQGEPGEPGKAVLAFGSLRGASIQVPGVTLQSVPFQTAGPLSETVTISQTGNELVIRESGVYQITASVSAEATAEPDAEQPYLNAVITVNGGPVFGDITSFFKVMNRSSSTFVVQAALKAGDEIGVGVGTDFPALGYMNRSLTIVQLSD